jgi:capsule polysaccharide export protein KpsC/LpsZ
MSLPVGSILVVKEHPWMVGKRTQNAYRKLLDIPRVHLAPPDVTARDLAAGASLVAVITGSVALEAAMLGKPVITFGDCPYNALPDSMIRRCQDLRRLPIFIRDVMREYRSDERALEAYVAATFETSESINLYSVLLNKHAVHVERQSAFGEEIEKLAAYALKRLREPDCPPGDPLAAEW